MKKNAVKKVFSQLPKLKTTFAKLSSQEVMVGVPQEESPRKGDEMNNATIAYIQDNGSPAANIPARSFMRPGVGDAKARVVRIFKKGAKDALNGNPEAVEQALNAAGMIVQAAIRKRINEGIPPPLADSTLKARIRKGIAVKGAKAELEARKQTGEKGSSHAKPLVATAQLRNSINYVLRSKK